MSEEPSIPVPTRSTLDGVQDHNGSRGSVLAAVSRAMVQLHREQFGRGPTAAQSHFAGPDLLVCALRGALLPAELRMVELGQEEQVRASRLSFQASTADEFVALVEQILLRRVCGFASAVDARAGTVYEIFHLARGEQ